MGPGIVWYCWGPCGTDPGPTAGEPFVPGRRWDAYRIPSTTIVGGRLALNAIPTRTRTTRAAPLTTTDQVGLRTRATRENARISAGWPAPRGSRSQAAPYRTRPTPELNAMMTAASRTSRG